MDIETPVVFCKKCVISNQRPSSVVEFNKDSINKKQTIILDDKGVCSACNYADKKNKNIDWEKREQELIILCDKYRSRNGSYDCIIPGSGGKDSAFTSHILKYKYNMNPLTVTWAPHEYTEIGWQNFQKWIEMGGFDNILITPNGKVHRLLTKLAFKNLCHPFQPFIIGQKIVGPRLALQNKIPLIFYGENQAEYGNDVDDNETSIMNNKFFHGSQDNKDLLIGGIPADKLITDYKIRESDLSLYKPIENKENMDLNMHYLGYFLKWDPQEMYYYAVENTGFMPNSERTEGSYSKYSGIDDKMDTLHYFTSFIKFGLGRASYDASQEIRNKKITREEGVSLVKKYDAETPKKYLENMLNYMDISNDDFWEIIDKNRSKKLWKKENNSWVLSHQVNNNP
ncbi:N-acetyl sugar amidotransferase [Alphaproteobacteria bacterium]|nr:N-acetyl sugar amidotransferase [Alphaproteobacteria bacterium]